MRAITLGGAHSALLETRVKCRPGGGRFDRVNVPASVHRANIVKRPLAVLRFRSPDI